MVIATRNRARRLAAALASLRAQTLGRDRFEVIVVDDASVDDTRAVLAAEQEQGALDLRVMTKSDAAGPGAARNDALGVAHGGLVAFMDDDCEATPRWLAALLEAWEEAPLRFIQGATTPIPAESAQIGPLAYSYDIRSLDLNFPTCNIAYPRELLERLGGFDHATFPYAAGEDCDLAFRAIAAGAEPRFAAEAHVHHAVVPLGRRGVLKRAWRWGTVVPAFARHPELRRRRLIYRVFFNWSHWYLLRLVAALILPWRRELWPLKLWLGYRYLQDRRWAPGSDRPSIGALSWNLVIDTVETAAMVRGAIRNRSLVL